MVGQNWLVAPDIRSRSCDATRMDRHGIWEHYTLLRALAFLAAELSLDRLGYRIWRIEEHFS